MDGSVDALFQLAMNNIKKSFVGASELNAPPQQSQIPDPAMIEQAVQTGQITPEEGQALLLQLQEQMGQQGDSENVLPYTHSSSEMESKNVENPVYDDLVSAVRQVIQEMGIVPNSETAEEPAQPKEEPKPKTSKGKVDPDDFAKLQAAVALILERLGLIDESAALAEAVTPTEQVDSKQDTEENKSNPEAQTAMGAHPGRAADLPAEAQPIGPLDPAASEAMAQAGLAGRRNAKLSSLLRGTR